MKLDIFVFLKKSALFSLCIVSLSVDADTHKHEKNKLRFYTKETLEPDARYFGPYQKIGDLLEDDSLTYKKGWGVFNFAETVINSGYTCNTVSRLEFTLQGWYLYCNQYKYKYFIGGNPSFRVKRIKDNPSKTGENLAPIRTD
jgi:hypothetical protein